MEQRVRLDGQVIEGQVRRRKLQRCRDVGARVSRRLSRQCIHEVEVDVAEDRQRRGRGDARLMRVVDATQRLKKARVEALYAQRQPVDAGAFETRELRLLEGARVGFQRRLGVGVEHDTRTYGGQDAVDRRRGEQAGRAAADEYARHAPAPDRRQREFHIGNQRVDVARFRNLATAFMRIEIAVRALFQAPRNVHVQRERRQRAELRRAKHDVDRRAHRSASRRATSARSACPRCDSAFFLSSGSSAPVIPVSLSSKCGS